MFNVKSVLPNVWANAVRNGDKDISEVPNLSNLIDVVNQILEGVE